MRTHVLFDLRLICVQVKAHMEALQVENDHLSREIAILRETVKVKYNKNIEYGIGWSSPVLGVLDKPYSQLTPLSGVAVQARQST
jgi:hypothetical protein